MQGAGPGAFPVYNVKDYGAVADGKTLNTEAIQKTVDQAAAAGGGTVFFPPGDYLTGTIRLRSNVTMYLENGCTVWGSKNLNDYDADHKHLLYADGAKNIVLCGQGAINGNGLSFWDKGRLARWLRGEIPLPRTADMIRFDRCQNVVLEDVDVSYGAFWNIGFGKCHRVTIRALTLRSGVYEDDGPNTDGINLWNCTRVQISDCDIITGDDCIVVLGDSRDVTITNCKLQTSETALMISGVRNLTFSNSTIHIKGLTLDNVRFFMYGGKTSELGKNPPYPHPIYGFHGGPYSLFFRHVDGLTLGDVHPEWNTPEKADWGSALRCWKVNDLDIDGFSGRQSAGSKAPAVELREVDGAFIRNCRAPKGTGIFLKLEKGTERVTIMGNDLSLAREVYTLAATVDPNEVHVSGNRLPCPCHGLMGRMSLRFWATPCGLWGGRCRRAGQQGWPEVAGMQVGLGFDL